VPDQECVCQEACVEQLHAAQLHQLGITVSLVPPLAGRLHREYFPDLVQVAGGWGEAVPPEAFVLVHDRFLPHGADAGAQQNPPVAYRPPEPHTHLPHTA